MMNKPARIALVHRSVIKVLDTVLTDDMVTREPVLWPPEEATIADICLSDILHNRAVNDTREAIQQPKLL
jgi:hypothetical protein